LKVIRVLGHQNICIKRETVISERTGWRSVLFHIHVHG